MKTGHLRRWLVGGSLRRTRSTPQSPRSSPPSIWPVLIGLLPR